MLEFYPEGARNNNNETGELPLHLVMRWICSGDLNFEEREDETIAMLLLMAYPEGATLRDHSGMTPKDILKMHQGEQVVDNANSIFQRLERYLSFASQISQNKISELPAEMNIQHSRLGKVDRATDSLEERDGPPIDRVKKIIKEESGVRGRQLMHDRRNRLKKASQPEIVSKIRVARKSEMRLRSRSKNEDSVCAERLLSEILDASDE